MEKSDFDSKFNRNSHTDGEAGPSFFVLELGEWNLFL